MIIVYSLHQTNRRLCIQTIRSTFSTLTLSKSRRAQVETDAISHHNLNFDNKTSRKLVNFESVPPNDLLEAKRIEQVARNDRTTASVSVGTNIEKFSIDRSTVPTSNNLFHDTKLSDTSVASSTSVAGTTLSTANAEDSRKNERIPSSRFSALLRSISSSLPFFSSRKNRTVKIDVSTTRECFIPLTRPSLIRLIATDSELIDDDKDRLLFHQLCQGFDSAVVQYYQPILNELKHLFNSLNPDNETLANRRISYRDRLDNEYWLLQKINDLLHRANFTELPHHVLLDKFIYHKDSLFSSNINVKINDYDYDVLKFWILGREQMSNEEKSWWKKFYQKNDQLISRDYFKRVIVAIRLKGQDRLYLKAFRDVSLQNFTQLLPSGKLQIGNFDQQLIRFTFLIGATTLVTHLITAMANYQVPGLVIGGSSLTLLFGLWSLRNFYQSKINYLSHMSQLLFHKNVASNKQLLAMITDRAQDELSKEVILVYMFIFWKQKQNNMTLTKKNLELEIEDWIRRKANTDITFNSDRSIELLRRLDILLFDDSTRSTCLQVISLEQVIGILPKISRILSEKNEEWDLIEGYDKKYFELDWKTVSNEDRILSKSGWY